MTDREVSLVIPGRNAESTLGPCLEAVVPMLGHGLAEIVFVDDGSTDRTAEVAARFPVRVVRGEGRGPGAARNLGWRAATSPLIWFVDSDCVAEPDALAVLLAHTRDSHVAGVGGSYGNMRPDSLVACLIHEEIVARHAAMPPDVDFLATFNVIYRRRCLEAVGGFDERFLKAQDAELAYRMLEAGWRLRFDARSRVRHFHESTLRPYLSTQMKQGFWRVSLYAEHPVRLGGDRYSSLLDHVQPPLALLLLALLLLVPLPPVALLCSAGFGLLALLQMPMALRLVRRTRDLRYLAFVGFGAIRAFARAIGMAAACYRQSQKLLERRYAS